MSKIFVDPPRGWQYGFPMAFTEEEIKNGKVKETMINNGYPKKDIEWALEHCRMWMADVE